MSPLRKIAAHYTLCPRTGWIPRAVLTFDSDGRLLHLEPDASRLDSIHGIEFYSGILIPGMVNPHCYLELSYLRESIPRGTGLDGFVEQIARIRGQAPESTRLHCAEMQDAVLRQQGVVAVGDICNDAFTFPLKQRSSIHYHNFIEIFGSDPSVADRQFERGVQVAGRAERLHLPFSLTPHATYSLSEPLFERTVEANPAWKPLSVHFMESPAESQLFRGTGPFAERYRQADIPADWAHFGSPAGRLIHCVASEIPLLLIHNTCVTEEDIDRIQDHFQSVTWVVCPRSNAYIEGSFPPIELLRRKGCRIAVGTDSLASNHSLSLVEELKLLTGRRPEIPLQELVRWVTANGARALEAEWAGSFEVGTSPGAVLLDHIDRDHRALSADSTARRSI
ncbi:MAG: amidohydrolase family protein [Rikenellaceae bacterium]|nr:amidohydrolase family protein [Rikenellaceae bacterium]